ncbi:PP2C family protein-serine/threonine phosphatase, partial [Acinetobacter pittii]
GRFIICSDGLHAQIDRELLADVAAAYGDPQVAADMLVQSALDAGGNDNVTVIVLDICGKSSDYSANDDWNVSKIDDHEDIGD